MRTAFALLGLVLVPLGLAGLVLPLLPGTPLLIAAAACFARSSPRFESYLVNHPRLGAPIRAWRETGAIPLRAKIVALAAMAISIWIIAAGNAPDMAKAAAISIMVGAGVFVATRRNS
jgi:uncharacterized membrane protein YbaN (DUF454 family)